MGGSTVLHFLCNALSGHVFSGADPDGGLMRLQPPSFNLTSAVSINSLALAWLFGAAATLFASHATLVSQPVYRIDCACACAPPPFRARMRNPGVWYGYG